MKHFLRLQVEKQAKACLLPAGEQGGSLRAQGVWSEEGGERGRQTPTKLLGSRQARHCSEAKKGESWIYVGDECSNHENFSQKAVPITGGLQAAQRLARQLSDSMACSPLLFY